MELQGGCGDGEGGGEGVRGEVVRDATASGGRHDLRRQTSDLRRYVAAPACFISDRWRYSTGSFQARTRFSRLLLCAKSRPRWVRRNCSGGTSSGVLFSIASRMFA